MKLPNSNHRFTKARKAFLHVLRNQHLTFKELHEKLSKLGYHNVSTLYNNVDFFLKNGMIIQFNIDGTTYYDLGSDNPFHESGNHLHFVTKDEENDSAIIKEFDLPEVYELIKQSDSLKKYEIDSIRILITGKEKN